MAYKWAAYAEAGWTFRNETSSRLTARYVIPQYGDISDEDLIENVHYFTDLSTYQDTTYGTIY